MQAARLTRKVSMSQYAFNQCARTHTHLIYGYGAPWMGTWSAQQNAINFSICSALYSTTTLFMSNCACQYVYAKLLSQKKYIWERNDGYLYLNRSADRHMRMSKHIHGGPAHSPCVVLEMTKGKNINSQFIELLIFAEFIQRYS